MMMLFDQEYIFNGFIKEQSEIAREEGRAEERAKAEQQFKETARSLQALNMPIEQIATIVNRSVDTVKQWLAPASMDSFPKA